MGASTRGGGLLLVTKRAGGFRACGGLSSSPECVRGNGVSYRGNQQFAAGGVPCLNWLAVQRNATSAPLAGRCARLLLGGGWVLLQGRGRQTAGRLCYCRTHAHTRTPRSSPLLCVLGRGVQAQPLQRRNCLSRPPVSEDHSSCRNPDSDAAPWCYVSGAAGTPERSLCAIAPCPGERGSARPPPAPVAPGCPCASPGWREPRSPSRGSPPAAGPRARCSPRVASAGPGHVRWGGGAPRVKNEGAQLPVPTPAAAGLAALLPSF